MLRFGTYKASYPLKNMVMQTVNSEQNIFQQIFYLVFCCVTVTTL